MLWFSTHFISDNHFKKHTKMYWSLGGWVAWVVLVQASLTWVAWCCLFTGCVWGTRLSERLRRCLDVCGHNVAICSLYYSRTNNPRPNYLKLKQSAPHLRNDYYQSHEEKTFGLRKIYHRSIQASYTQCQKHERYIT